MERIASFTVNHDLLEKGMYISRIDGDIVTYDIRMVLPNGGVYLENAAMHTFEHLFATFVRNTPHSANIVYVGPMGCRTGFYFLTRGVSHQTALELMRQTLDFIAAYTGEVPGTTRIECGNYQEHDLPGARRIAADMAQVLAGWRVEDMRYKE